MKLGTGIAVAGVAAAAACMAVFAPAEVSRSIAVCASFSLFMYFLLK